MEPTPNALALMPDDARNSSTTGNTGSRRRSASMRSKLGAGTFVLQEQKCSPPDTINGWQSPPTLGHSQDMRDGDAQRAYLKAALHNLGVKPKHASLAIDKNHGYLGVYIRGKSPDYLSEQDREALVKAYGLDGDKLKPPPKQLKPPSRRSPMLQDDADLLHQIEEEKLLFAWRRIEVKPKIAIMTVILELVKASDRDVA